MKKLVLICITLLLFAGCEGPNGWPTEKFSSAEWQAAPEQTRYKFVRDLISSERLVGMNKSEVVTLLGPPSSESEVPNVIYVVKTGGAGFNQVFMMDIRFANGKVNQVLVRGD